MNSHVPCQIQFCSPEIYQQANCTFLNTTHIAPKEYVSNNKSSIFGIPCRTCIGQPKLHPQGSRIKKKLARHLRKTVQGHSLAIAQQIKPAFIFTKIYMLNKIFILQSSNSPTYFKLHLLVVRVCSYHMITWQLHMITWPYDLNLWIQKHQTNSYGCQSICEKCLSYNSSSICSHL